MLIFGHAGIILGAVLLVNTTLRKGSTLHSRENKAGVRSRHSPEAKSAQDDPRGGRASWPIRLMNHVDVRLLLIGSLLPDIIDKPIGMFFFRDIFSNGRIFSHTLFFFLLITMFGVYLYRSRRKTYLLVLSFGTFIHLVLDQMWLNPQTLLWPLYGFAFGKRVLTFWTQNIFYVLYTDPAVYVPELLGIIISFWFVLVLARRRQLVNFIKSGRVIY